MRPLLLPSALLAAALLLASQAHAQGASFEGLGFLAGGSFGGDPTLYSNANGVSVDGSVVVGNSLNASGEGEAFRWTAGGGMQGLGDLPGGIFSSGASDVSDHGSVIVGQGNSENGSEAFRWTAVGGMQGLGDLPGSDFSNHTTGASADGAVVVGASDGAIWIEAFRWTAAGGMQGLGYISGGGDNPASRAQGVSADGSVVVGYSIGASGYEPFRWTAGGGMVGLGRLSGFPSSLATGVSADGSVIVGYSINASGIEAFVWTQASGMRRLHDVLTAQGIDLAGWTLLSAQAVSDDGTVIVGTGLDPQGLEEAFRAVLPRLALLNPAPGALLVGGERYRIRWIAPESVAVVDLNLLPDTLGAAPVPVAFHLPAADSAFTWAVPDAIFSRSARLVLSDAADPATADTSDLFRLHPYFLARFRPGDPDSTYEPFNVARHGWQYANTQANWFPASWFSQPQFDYQDGEDPFTGDDYPDDFSAPPVHALPPIFPDWPAYVRAFGTDDAYASHLFGQDYEPTFLAAWAGTHGGTHRWNGSCYGLAATSLLAFTHRAQFGAAYPAVGPVEHLFDVAMSDGAREAVNTQFCYQDGKQVQAVQLAALAAPQVTPRQTLAALKTLLLSDTAADNQAVLTLKDVSSCSPFAANGGHAVLPYRLQRDPAACTNASGCWRIYVYDSNLPGSNAAFVVVDSTLDAWIYNQFNPSWGGTCGLFLRDPIVDYLQEAVRHDPGFEEAQLSRRTGLFGLRLAGSRVMLGPGRSSWYDTNAELIWPGISISGTIVM